MKKSQTPAVIYCRVSSVKQVKEGHGLHSQQTRCREYASLKGYDVIAVFDDEGVSGSLIDRPGMHALLSFLKKNRHLRPVVLIDDVSRLARGLEAHIQLRTAIGTAGGKLESPSIEFGEDSDSILVENLLASVSQHQRQKNAEQVTNRMRARVRNGYWISVPPVGYKYKSIPGHGKMLVRDEPLASVIAEALEGFAHGRFQTQTEVKRFLDHHAVYPKGRDGKVHFQRVANLLGRVLYAGYITLPEWGIHLQPAKHEPLISLQTFEKIQDRLKGQAKVPARTDLNDDFPLRGFVTCDCCGNALMACWAKGRTKMYPYYFCQTKGCEIYGKSVRKEKIEAEFEELLTGLRPSQNMFHLAKAMFTALWDDRMRTRGQETQQLKLEEKRIGQQIKKLVDRVVEADSVSLVSAYEERIRALEHEKLILGEQIRQCGTVLPDFEESFRTAFAFLSNPKKLWESQRLEDRRTVLKLVFADRLSYHRDRGFSNRKVTLPFSMLGDFQPGKSLMVHRHGLKSAVNHRNTVVTAHITNILLFGTNLAYLPAGASLASFSRDMEREADQLGMQYLASAQYDVRQSPAIFERFAQLPKANSVAGSIYSSHPDNEERIQYLNEQISSQYPQSVDPRSPERFVDVRSRLVDLNVNLRLRSKQYQMTLDLLDETATYYPHQETLIYYRGEARRLMADDPAAAAKEYAWLNERSETEADKQRFLAAAEDNRRQAIQLFTSILESPDAPRETHRGLGLIYQQQGDKDKARFHLQAYLAQETPPKDRLFIQHQLDQLN
jgi:DNA invertase Pin-like site-specific DNA recombinase